MKVCGCCGRALHRRGVSTASTDGVPPDAQWWCNTCGSIYTDSREGLFAGGLPRLLGAVVLFSVMLFGWTYAFQLVQWIFGLDGAHSPW